MSNRPAPARPPGRPKASPDEVAQRRQEIVTAAWELFAERGYRATGIGDIAKHLGAAHGTVYLYFKSKRDILEAVLDLVLERFIEASFGAGLQQPETAEQFWVAIDDAATRNLDLLSDNPGMIRLMLFEIPAIDPELTTRMLGLMATFRALLAVYLADAAARGFLRTDLDADSVARAIQGVFLAGALGLLAGDFDQEARRRYVQSVTAFLASGETA